MTTLLNAYDITNLAYAKLSSYINERISGKTYHQGCRPTDSTLEDAEIVFSAADAEQVQQGFIYINIFVKDIESGLHHMVENRKRISQLISIDIELCKILNALPYYRWTIDETTRIIEEPDTAEHFISIKFRFKHKINKNKN